MIPKVTHIGPVPMPPVTHIGASPHTGPPRIASYNAAKVTPIKNLSKKYYGSMIQYHGWRVISEFPTHGGRVDLIVSRGVKVAEIKSARASSVITG